MKLARIVFRKLLGLVVDDWRLALSIAVWLALTWLTLPRLGLVGGIRGLILFIGIALILTESTWRQARRLHRNAVTR